jgi:hypothetical protein
MAMSMYDVRQQSLNAYNQWCVQWREHALINGKLPQRPFIDFVGKGIGKAVLCVANGRSFEEQIEIIKENQHKVDILCCDKTLGHLLNNGIKPTYCMVCDANVNYESYMKPWENELSNTVLFSNICGNPKWTRTGNWKGIYFFCNKDIIMSEREFSALSGCTNFIPAGTNVSNQMIVLLTQCDETGPKNYFGYDKILLTGYDYCWRDNKYYAFDDEGQGKNNYMRHMYVIDGEGNYCYTSGNLYFSMQWIDKYTKAYKSPIIQCTKHSIFPGLKQGDLREQMQYNFNKEDSEKVREYVKIKDNLLRNLGQLDKSLEDIARKHYLNFLATT